MKGTLYIASLKGFFMKKSLLIVVFAILIMAMGFSGCSSPANDVPGPERLPTHVKGTGVPTTAWYDNPTTPTEFTLNTPDDLAGLAQIVNGELEPAIAQDSFIGKTITLGANVDLSAYGKGKAFNGGKGWISIGTGAFQFKGTFNGNGKTIIGLYINDNDPMSTNWSGLFGIVLGGTVEKLGLVNVDISGYLYVGGLAGGIGDDGMIANCYVTGSVEGKNYVGGIVGTIAGGSGMTNCYVTCKVFSENDVGGLVGKIWVNERKIVDNAALNSSVIDSVSDAGRIAGPSQAGSLSGNVAFSDMIVKLNGSAKALDLGDDKVDGENITKEQIARDGTIGGRFITANGWTVQNGKLPGFGEAVDMPAHLR